jgi:RNA polymerase sigma-70 factor (ECF subfamily)
LALVGAEADADVLGTAHALYDAGRAAWPTLAVDPSAFVQHVEWLAKRAGSVPAPAHAADLYLAFACYAGISAAIQAFSRRFDGTLQKAIARVDGRREFIDEVVQHVREKLFVSKAGSPKIGEYAGRAPLGAFLRTVAVRTAFNARRSMASGEHASVSENDAEPKPTGDPELAYLKARYKHEFERSFRVAIESLSAHERTLLRLHIVEDFTIDAVARLYGVGRSTAARWIASAREALFHATRADLVTRLRLTPSEIESLGMLVQSQLELGAKELLSPPERNDDRDSKPPGRAATK